MQNLSILAGLTPVGFKLGNVKFFEPKPVFFDFMSVNYYGKVIFDVGAGCGHVSKALTDRGHRVIGIDCAYRDTPEFEHTIIADATIFPYEKGSVILIARPCHGPFVEQVIVQAELSECSAVVYVGLERNVDDDLGLMRKPFKKAKVTDVGKDGESIYVWNIKRRKA